MTGEKNYLWQGTVDVPGENPGQAISIRAPDYKAAYDALEERYGKHTVRYLIQMTPPETSQDEFQRGHDRGRQDERRDRETRRLWPF